MFPTLASLLEERMRDDPDLCHAAVHWVAPFVKSFEEVYKKMPQEFSEHPVNAFKRNVYVNPFWEDALEGLLEIMTPDRLLVGSDYPHPEGLGNPIEFVDDLPADLNRDDVAKIMGGNLKSLLKV